MKHRVPANWGQTILVCAKCSKKLKGGFGPKGRTPLAKALRKHLGLRKGRKAEAGIVEVKCMGVCPRGAVTVVDAGGPREWLLRAELGAIKDRLANVERIVTDGAHMLDREIEQLRGPHN